MSVLLSGGAGYIGSSCLRTLRRQGEEAFALDDLSEGCATAVRADRLIRADLRDREIDAVMHFAALVSLPGSLTDTSAYWFVNVDGTLSLVEAMRAAGVQRLVAFSTAAAFDRATGSL